MDPNTIFLLGHLYLCVMQEVKKLQGSIPFVYPLRLIRAIINKVLQAYGSKEFRNLVASIL
jgi:hypothetical protein